MANITLNGANFYYEIHGQGQPLILIAGYSANHLYWMPILGELSQHFQVLIFDNRGAGKTTDDGRELSAELMADDVVAIGKALDLKKPHILGVSMGGAIAQCIATRHPDYLNKLIILVSTAKWRQAMLIGVKAAIEMHEENVDIQLQIESTLAWIYGEQFLQNEKNIELFKRMFLENPLPQSTEDQYRQYHVLKTFDGRDRLNKIKTPTLVGYGVQDIIVLPNESRFLTENIPNAKLMEFNSAHAIVLEQARELLGAVISFLQEKI